MPSKTFEVNFRINGEVSSSLMAAIRASQNSMKGLASTSAQASKLVNPDLMRTFQALQRISTAASSVQPLQSVIAKTALATNAASAQTNQLASAYGLNQKRVRALEAELATLRTNTLKQRENYRTQRAEVRQYQERLSSLQKQLKQGKSTISQSETVQIQAQISATSGKLDELKSKLAETRREQERLRSATKQASESLSQQRKAESESARELTSSQRNLTNLQSQLQSQRSALSSLQASLSNAGFSSSNFSQQQARLQSEINRTTEAINRQVQSAQRQQQYSAASQNLSNSYGNFQNALTTAQTIASPFKSAIDNAIEFERVMSEVKSLTQMDNIRAGNLDLVNEKMQMLTKTAMRLGAQTIFTSTEIAKGMTYIARTGWTDEQVNSSIEGFVKLAAASHMNVDRVADISTNIMTAFGIDSKDSKAVNKALDTLMYTTTHSNQNLEQLGDTLKYVAPVAKMTGNSLETTAAFTKFLVDSGIQSTMAGTSMRQTLLRLVAPPKKAAKAMDEYGISMGNAMEEWQAASATAESYGIKMSENVDAGRQLISIVKQIDKNMAGASDQEKIAAFAAITGINAVSGATAGFTAGAANIEHFTDLLDAATGALDQSYEVMVDNTYGATEALKSALDNVSLQVGFALLPAVRSAAEAVTPLVAKFSDWAMMNPQVIQGAAAIAAGLATVTVAAAGVQLAFAGFNFVSAGIGLAADAVAAFNARMIAMTSISSITATAQSAISTMTSAISAGFTTARVAMASFIATAQSQGILTALGSAFRGLGSAIIGAFSPAMAILAALALAGYYVYNNWDKVAPVFENIGNTIQNLFNGVGDNLTPSLNNLMEALQRLAPVAENLGGVIFGAMAVIGNAIVNTIAAAITTVADVIKTVIDLASGIGNVLASALAGDWAAAWEAMKNTAETFITNIKTAIVDTFSGVFDIFANLYKPLEWMGVMSPSKYSTENYSTVKQIQQPNENAVLAASLASLAEKISTSTETDQSRISEQLLQISQTLAQNESQRESSEQLLQLAESLKSDNVDKAEIAQSISQIAQSIQAEKSSENVNVQQLNEAVSTASESVNQSAQSMATVNEAVSTAGETINQSAQSMLSVNEAAMQTGTAFQNVNTEILNQATNLQQNAAELGNHMTALQSSEQQISIFNETLTLPISNLQILSENSSNAASSVSNLGTAASGVVTALSNAASAIANIKISAPTISAAKNATGGIYPRGAFLTWLAEDSAEAAIPLDGSRRAVSLWQQAGVALGLLNSEGGYQNVLQVSQSSTARTEIQRQIAQVAANTQNFKAASLSKNASGNWTNSNDSNFNSEVVYGDTKALQNALQAVNSSGENFTRPLSNVESNSNYFKSLRAESHSDDMFGAVNNYSDDNSRQMNFTININYSGNNFNDFERQFRDLMHDLQRRSYQ